MFNIVGGLIFCTVGIKIQLSYCHSDVQIGLFQSGFFIDEMQYA